MHAVSETSETTVKVQGAGSGCAMVEGQSAPGNHLDLSLSGLHFRTRPGRRRPNPPHAIAQGRAKDVKSRTFYASQSALGTANPEATLTANDRASNRPYMGDPRHRRCRSTLGVSATISCTYII